jgi:hypothetical protein
MTSSPGNQEFEKQNEQAAEDLMRAEELAQKPGAGIVEKIEGFLKASQEERNIAVSKAEVAKAASKRAAISTTVAEAKRAATEASQASESANQAAEKTRKIMQEAVPLLKAVHNKSVRADFLFDRLVGFEGEAESAAILAARAVTEAKAAVTRLENEV